MTVLLAVICLAVSCAGGGSSREFTPLEGIQWKLTGVETPSGFLHLDRPLLKQAGQEDFFTLVFRDGLYNGRAAPNLYRGPYELGSGQTITIKPAAATLMASLVELEGITESEYYGYLERSVAWTTEAGVLKLHGVTSGGGPVTLVFAE
jgi:hypothetical protein